MTVESVGEAPEANPSAEPVHAEARLETRTPLLDGASAELAQVLAELIRVRDRIRRDSAAGGYRPLPGQTARIAALRRQEQVLINDLRLREPPG